MKNKLIILGATILISYGALSLARGDQGPSLSVTWQGRTEPAHCYTPSDSDPAITTCISESFLCTLVGGAIDCVVKRS